MPEGGGDSKRPSVVRPPLDRRPTQSIVVIATTRKGWDGRDHWDGKSPTNLSLLDNPWDKLKHRAAQKAVRRELKVHDRSALIIPLGIVNYGNADTNRHGNH